MTGLPYFTQTGVDICLTCPTIAVPKALPMLHLIDWVKVVPEQLCSTTTSNLFLNEFGSSTSVLKWFSSYKPILEMALGPDDTNLLLVSEVSLLAKQDASKGNSSLNKN